MLSLLFGPAPTAVYDSWKNYSFDYADLCQQSDVSDCAESHSNLHLSFLGCLLFQSISEGANVEAVTDFIFPGSQITADNDRSEKLKDACFLEGEL